MTISAREAALAGLFTLLGTALSDRSPPSTVLRNETIPQRLSPGGLVVLLDGETLEAEPVLGIAQYWIRHQALIEIHAPGATEPARRLLMDALLQAIATALATNRTLGGAVDGAEAQPATAEDSATEGAAPIRSAALPVDLYFSATTPNS